MTALPSTSPLATLRAVLSDLRGAPARLTSSPDVSGQAYAFMAMTPVRPGELQALTGFLRGLRAEGGSPFDRLPRTHVARLVVVEDFHHDPSWGQPEQDSLDLPYLVFTACLDGDLGSWLDELCRALAPEAPQVWGRCVGGPTDGDPAALAAYLRHNQISTGLFFAAYGDATVDQVRAALRRRERLIAFACRAQGLDPAALQRAFLEEFAGAPPDALTGMVRQRGASGLAAAGGPS